jgi:hypothetical protein
MGCLCACRDESSPSIDTVKGDDSKLTSKKGCHRPFLDRMANTSGLLSLGDEMERADRIVHTRTRLSREAIKRRMS